MRFVCDFKFFSAPEGAVYDMEEYGRYTEVCDGCGMRKRCNCFTSTPHFVIMDLCPTCQKKHMKKVVE